MLLDWERRRASLSRCGDAGARRGRAARRAAAIHTVVVAGEVVLREGRVARVDKAAVLEELSAALRRPLTPDEEHRRRLSRALFPHVRRFYDGWLDPGSLDPFYRQSSRS